MNWVTHTISFIFGASIGLVVGMWYMPIKTPAKPETIVIEQANQVVETNSIERAKVDVNWFKDNNNYIWDGWKIK